MEFLLHRMTKIKGREKVMSATSTRYKVAREPQDGQGRYLTYHARPET